MIETEFSIMEKNKFTIPKIGEKILRRSKRYDRFLPVSVLAIDGEDETIEAGPFQGRTINISRHGSCLLLPRVLVNTYHIFHSTREKESNFLQLTINIQPDIIEYKIPSRPIWLDIFHEGDIHAFKIGVEFMVNPEGNQIKLLEQVIRKK